MGRTPYTGYEKVGGSRRTDASHTAEIQLLNEREKSATRLRTLSITLLLKYKQEGSKIRANGAIAGAANGDEGCGMQLERGAAKAGKLQHVAHGDGDQRCAC